MRVSSRSNRTNFLFPIMYRLRLFYRISSKDGGVSVRASLRSVIISPVIAKCFRDSRLDTMFCYFEGSRIWAPGVLLVVSVYLVALKFEFGLLLLLMCLILLSLTSLLNSSSFLINYIG